MPSEYVVKATFISCAIVIEPRTLKESRKTFLKAVWINLKAMENFPCSEETFWVNIQALKTFLRADKHEKLDSGSIKLWKISAILQD